MCSCPKKLQLHAPPLLNPQCRWPHHRYNTNINSLVWFKQPFLYGHQQLNEVLKIIIFLWGLREQTSSVWHTNTSIKALKTSRLNKQMTVWNTQRKICSIFYTIHRSSAWPYANTVLPCTLQTRLSNMWIGWQRSSSTVTAAGFDSVNFPLSFSKSALQFLLQFK